MTDDDEGLKPIETEPATGGDEPADDSLLGFSAIARKSNQLEVPSSSRTWFYLALCDRGPPRGWRSARPQP